MTQTYHRLIFIPTLGMGSQFTVGAVVQTEDGLSWVEAPLLPPASYLHPKSRLLLETMLADLAEDPEAGMPRNPFPPEALEERPGTRRPRISHLGNHFRTEPPRRLPEHVADPVAWVRERTLPQSPEASGRRQEKVAQAGQRGVSPMS